MATRYTRKKKNFSNKEIANKLDKLANNIAKRNIYVVKKTPYGFNILNYVTKHVFVEDIPFQNVANRYCKVLNNTKDTQNPRSIQRHIDLYHKHWNDIQFYKNTIKSSDDKVRVFTAGVRMADSLQFVKEAKKQLSFF